MVCRFFIPETFAHRQHYVKQICYRYRSRDKIILHIHMVLSFSFHDHTIQAETCESCGRRYLILSFHSSTELTIGSPTHLLAMLPLLLLSHLLTSHLFHTVEDGSSGARFSASSPVDKELVSVTESVSSTGSQSPRQARGRRAGFSSLRSKGSGVSGSSCYS